MKRILSVLLLSLFAAVAMAGTEVYTPTLRSPVDDTINQMPNVTVSWNAIVGSINLQYEVQLDTNVNFNSPKLSDTVQVLLTGFTTHGLLFNTKYYWRVRAIDLGETSGWSTARKFTVFSQVSLTFPDGNNPPKLDTVAPLQVLAWSNKVGKAVITGVKYFDIQCDINQNFNSSQLISGTVTAAKFYFWVSNLRFGTKYYWRVRARHDLGASPWSAVSFFTVTNTIVQKEPLNKAPDQSLDALLKWYNVKGLLGYEYQLATDSLYTELIAGSGVDTNFVNSQFTKFGIKYYWRVRGRTVSDTSGWSKNFSFTTIDLVKLMSPSNNSTNIGIRPIMKWTKQTGIVKYQLQVDVTQDFSSTVLFTDVKLSDTLTTFTLTKNLKYFTTYYWRMRAFSDSQMPDTSGWSSVYSFKTLPTGIEENSGISSNIYPNPASGKVNIKIDADQPMAVQVSVISLLGTTFSNEELELNAGINHHEINISNLSKGIYIIRLNYGGNVTNHKLIVDR